MTTWQPPIPAGALYTRPARALGPALPLLAWCYDNVLRDGTFKIALKEVAHEMDEPYQNVKRWWAAVAAGPWFLEVVDRGRLGYAVTFHPRWLDWRMLSARPAAELPPNVTYLMGNVEVPKMILEGNDKDGSSTDEVPLLNHEPSAEAAHVPLKYSSSTDEVPKMILEQPAYKVLMDDHESPPPPTTESQPPRANAAIAVGGGGGRWRSHPVYQLFVQPKYGILSADRLMPDWQDAPPDQVQKLLERLYAQHYSANAPNQVAGRMYRALQAGPGVLLKPPARAAPAAAPAVPVPRTDTRAIAAIFLEGRNGKSNAD